MDRIPPNFVFAFILQYPGWDCYPPTKLEVYSCGIVRASIHSFRASVCPEPYLSTYYSDLINSWYK